MTDTTMSSGEHPLKRMPKEAVQHVTAGPYSPVLEVNAERLVVLSGQVAVDIDGNVVGTSMEEQAEAALANCRRHLEAAGCGFRDVFKVNVYLADVAEWSRFNAVYARFMPPPQPVRTAVQAVLLDGYRVEIEMWAVKPASDATGRKTEGSV
jgi:2-iminobutanoate/2-iminopropanoate deaminase